MNDKQNIMRKLQRKLKQIKSRSFQKHYSFLLQLSCFTFFPGPLAFCKKAVERVNSEKNILNSSVECVEWSGVVFLEKVICMYIIRSASMS